MIWLKVTSLPGTMTWNLELNLIAIGYFFQLSANCLPRFLSLSPHWVINCSSTVFRIHKRLDYILACQVAKTKGFLRQSCLLLVFMVIGLSEKKHNSSKLSTGVRKSQLSPEAGSQPCVLLPGSLQVAACLGCVPESMD